MISNGITIKAWCEPARPPGLEGTGPGGLAVLVALAGDDHLAAGRPAATSIGTPMRPAPSP
jgi:hypothetical protein